RGARGQGPRPLLALVLLIGAVCASTSEAIAAGTTSDRVLGAKGLEVLAHDPMEDGALHGPGLVAGGAHTRRPQPGACRPGSAGKRPIPRGRPPRTATAACNTALRARAAVRRRSPAAGGAASRPATSPTPPAGARARLARRSPADGPAVSCRAAPAAAGAAPAASAPGRRTAR